MINSEFLFETGIGRAGATGTNTTPSMAFALI
jgi:hypothetical protein